MPILVHLTTNLPPTLWYKFVYVYTHPVSLGIPEIYMYRGQNQVVL